MKALNTYIIEKFQVGNDYQRQYSYTPKNKYELITYIKEKIEQYGLGTKDNPLDLNDIDTSKIVDMSFLFSTGMGGNLIPLSKKGHFDIADWDVSNVEDMNSMFFESAFNGDISGWDVSKVKKMKWMFAKSKFDGDLSSWDVSNVRDMKFMFSDSKFTGKNGDIYEWKVKEDTDMTYMFARCPLKNNPPKWYKKRYEIDK